MYQMAKTAREKMKAKARSLAGEKDQKVDSSDWTPAPLLRAEVKTGARPIMKPSSKGIGESNAARDTKAAIGKDLKRGAFKSGGVVKDAGIKDKKALGAIDPSPKRGAAGHYNTGGRAKKADGGILGTIANALAGRGYIDGSTWLPQDTPITASDAAPARAAAPVRRPRPVARPRPRVEVESPQLTNEYALQERYPYIDQTISGAEVPMQSGRFIPGYKKGGKVKKAEGGGSWLQKTIGGGEREKREREIRDVGKGQTSNYSQEDRGALNRALRSNDALPASGSFKKGGRTKKEGGGGSWLEKMVGKPKSGSDLSGVGKGRTSSYSSSDKEALSDIAKGGSGSTLPSNETEFGKSQNYKKGGRAGRATGGLINALKGATKKSSKKGSKTDIVININAGHRAPMRRPAADAIPTGAPAIPPDMSQAAIGAGAPAMPPMGAGGPPMAAPGLIPGRKAGGRITKVAKSYKDMEAGAASAEGRLQKTDIAKLHKDAPARKAGGRISKIAKSYKDMTAGSGSGEGRLQKEDIAIAKKGRGK